MTLAIVAHAFSLRKMGTRLYKSLRGRRRVRVAGAPAGLRQGLAAGGGARCRRGSRGQRHAGTERSRRVHADDRGQRGSDRLADGGTRAAATPYSTAVLAAKPIAYYRFEDPEGTDVESDVGGQKYEAKIKGNVTHVPGALGPSGGNAVHFSGAGGSIEAAPRSFLFPKDESFVLELWVRPAAPPDQSARRVLELGAGTKDSYFLTYGGTSSGSTRDDAMDNLYFAVSWQGDGFDMAGCVSPKIPMNAWTYVVMDFGNAPEMYLFVNAKQADLWHVGEPSRVPAAAARFFLGSDPQGKNVFDGDIDEVAIYRSSLDQKTMAAHYAAAGRH